MQLAALIVRPIRGWAVLPKAASNPEGQHLAMFGAMYTRMLATSTVAWAVALVARPARPLASTGFVIKPIKPCNTAVLELMVTWPCRVFHHAGAGLQDILRLHKNLSILAMSRTSMHGIQLQKTTQRAGLSGRGHVTWI